MANIRYGSTSGSNYENVDIGSGTKSLANILFSGTGNYSGKSVEYALKDGSACVLFCYAMVLYAMGASVNKYDYRTDTVRTILADPYSCLMANLGISGDWSATLKTKQIAYTGGNASPNTVNYNNLLSQFGKSRNYTNLSNPSTGSLASARDNAAAITNALKSYPSGVIVRCGVKEHSFVVVSSTYDATKTYSTISDIGNCFKVYDSAGASGTNINFNSSWSCNGSTGYSPDDFSKLTRYDTIS